MKDKEDKHAGEGGQEEDTTTNSVDQEGSTESPEQVPNLEDTVDKELHVGVGNTDGIEDTVEVVGNETIAGPLGEESEGDDDPETLQVASLGEDGLPANVSGDGAIKFNGCLDFLKLVLDQGVLAKIKAIYLLSIHLIISLH